MSRLLRALWLSMWIVFAAAAQTVTGTITGTVTDPGSLPVAGATVILRNENTGAQQTLDTGNTGDFVFVALLPGTYTIAATKPGFKKMEKRNLNITAAERLSAGNLMLAVGDVTESVTVDASGTPVQVNSEERSGLLTTNQMETLMARGRDFLSLLRVMPGVVPSTDSEAIGSRTAYPNAQ